MNAPRRRTGWLIYAALLTLFVLVGEARNVWLGPGIDWVTLADWVLTAVLLTATWGYALQKRIGVRGYWRASFWIVAFATVVMLVPVALGPPEAAVFTGVLLALVAPAYLAAFRYAYRSPGLWTAADANGG